MSKNKKRQSSNSTLILTIVLTVVMIIVTIACTKINDCTWYSRRDKQEQLNAEVIARNAAKEASAA